MTYLRGFGFVADLLMSISTRVEAHRLQTTDLIQKVSP